MALRREVPCRTPDRAHVLGSAALVLLLGALTAGMVAGPRAIKCFESKGEIAIATARQYAYEAYPSWAAAHPDRACPVCLHELNEYTNNKSVRDPWGNEYQMSCDGRGIVVQSVGEDGRSGTADDISSR